MSDDWLGMSACDLGRGIGAGGICPVALCERFLDAAAAHPFGDRIYARLMRGQALDAAAGARARARAGQRAGLLDGVPVSWKDLFDTAGVATEAGSALLRGRIPERDARVVERLAMAGLPPLGKTHMTELAFSGLGLNPVTQSPPCVNDIQAVSGGSSSGAAASVAFGLAPVAVGSDTGGSVRVPAAWNDLVGLKTTAGRIPLDGVVPLAPSFDTVGPLARTVEDAAQLFALLDGTAAPDLGGATLAGARFLVLETVALDGLEPGPARGFERALARLSAAGARIEHGRIPAVAEALDLAGVLYAPECYATWGALIETDPEAMFPPVLARFRSGKGHEAHAHVAARQRLARLAAAFGAASAGYDAVLLPSVPIAPPPIAAVTADHALFTERNLLALRNTRIGNMMGLCALSLPTGIPSAGISLMAPPLHEARLLRLGAAAEAALRV